MRTSRPFSTISYNTTEFLHCKLTELLRRGVLDFWVFIEHLPEDDETKKHKHLYCVPSKLLDTVQFVNELKEVNPLMPLDKPLGCINPRSSKFPDWYLYCLHNKAYLLSKGQKRKHFYSDNDLVTSDVDYLRDLIHQIDFSKLNRTQVIVEAVENNISFETLVRQGRIPIQLINQYRLGYDIISGRLETYRNDRMTHTPTDELARLYAEYKAKKEKEERK